jgi:hypothetical protein
MPTIHLQVCAGLANRIRALVSGLCLSEYLSIPLVIHWFPRSPECACRFQTVLDPESLLKGVTVVPEDLWDARSVQSPEDWQTVYESWDRQSDLLLKSHGVFYKSDSFEKHLCALKPSPSVRILLDKRTANIPWGKAVGVHIRRTDNTHSIKGSPTEVFFKAMRDMSDSFFVVATDDTKVKEQIEKEFERRCLFPASVLTRRSEEGMIHSAVDFFALSKCTKILGSYYSSFGDFAARYGNIPLTIVKDSSER